MSISNVATHLPTTMTMMMMMLQVQVPYNNNIMIKRKKEKVSFLLPTPYCKKYTSPLFSSRLTLLLPNIKHLRNDIWMPMCGTEFGHVKIRICLTCESDFKGYFQIRRRKAWLVYLAVNYSWWYAQQLYTIYHVYIRPDWLQQILLAF